MFQDPHRTAVLSADTGVVPVGDVDFKPDVVEVGDTGRLGAIPGAGAEDRETWYRTAVLQENGLTGDEGFFDGEDYRLTVQVVTVPQGTDPESTGEDFHSAWTYVLPPAEGVRQSTSAFLEDHITLQDVATSMEVTAPCRAWRR